jgi:hypothetical protein
MSLTFHKPDNFAIDVIPTKSQMVPDAYAVSFVTDSPFEVRFAYIDRNGEQTRQRLYADKPLDQDLMIYGVCEIIPDRTRVEIVPVEDAIKKAERSVLEYARSAVSQVLHKQSEGVHS